MNECSTYHFHKTKYGRELLIDLIRMETLENYIRRDPVHRLAYFDISLILEGEGTFGVDEFLFPVAPGQLFFTAPGQVRQWKVSNMPRGLVLLFEEEFLCTFFNDTQFVRKLSFFSWGTHPPALSLTCEQLTYLEGLLADVEKGISDQEGFHLLRALLYHVLAWLDSQYRSQFGLLSATDVNTKVHRFTQLVEQNFRIAHAVNFYAGQLCITPGYLNDLVKEQFGLTVKQYIQNRLIIEAKRLLQYSELPVTEIAWQLNFQDPSYFIRLFRRAAGLSPLSFRKMKNP